MTRLMDPKQAVLLERVVAKRTVRIKIYPYTEYEEVDRATARHLFRLLQRYNFCLEDKGVYQERWASFWPGLSAVERKSIVLLVMSNTGGNFGVRVEPKTLPVEFEQLEGMVAPCKPTSAIEAELKRIVGRFNSRLATREEITACLSAANPEAYQALLPSGGALLAYEGSLLLPDQFAQRAFDAYLAVGIDRDKALGFARSLDGALEELLINKEMYNGVWPQ